MPGHFQIEACILGSHRDEVASVEYVSQHFVLGAHFFFLLYNLL